MESLKGTQYNCIFLQTTSMCFSAGLYAKIVGLNSQGIGLENSLLLLAKCDDREYIAIFVMNRVHHSIVIAIIMGFSIIATGVNYLFFKGVV